MLATVTFLVDPNTVLNSNTSDLYGYFMLAITTRGQRFNFRITSTVSVAFHMLVLTLTTLTVRKRFQRHTTPLQCQYRPRHPTYGLGLDQNGRCEPPQKARQRIEDAGYRGIEIIIVHSIILSDLNAQSSSGEPAANQSWPQWEVLNKVKLWSNPCPLMAAAVVPIACSHKPRLSSSPPQIFSAFVARICHGLASGSYCTRYT